MRTIESLRSLVFVAAGLTLIACQAGQTQAESQPVEKEIAGALEAVAAEPLNVLPEIDATPDEASFLLDSFEVLINPPEVLDTSIEAIAHRTMARYFQADVDTSALTRAEVLESFSAMEQVDVRDGTLTQSEFRATYNSRRMAVPGDEKREVLELMRGRDPWVSLTTVIDTDNDGALSLSEVRTFIDSRL